MTISYDYEKFVRLYNDHTLPITEIAKQLGMSERTIRNIANKLRFADEYLPKRTGREGVSKPTGEITIQPICSPDRPIEEVVQMAIEHSKRKIEHHKAQSLVEVNIDIEGPFAVVGLPDPHLDNPGTNLARAMEHAHAIRDTEGVYALCVGDILDNFQAIRPLQHARNEHIVTVSESFRLQEYWLTQLAPKLVGVSSGNHDDWLTRAGFDPLSYVLGTLGRLGIYGRSQVRLNLKPRHGHSFVHLVRHTFPGSSVYNSGHGILKWALQQWQGEDVMWGGHIHSAAIQQIDKPSLGIDKTVTLMQLGTYKTVDEYCIDRGFRVNMPHDAALVVHDPETGETTPFANIERGIDYLTWLRSKR